MTCPAPLARSMYADGALPAHEAAEIERHLTGCDACRSQVARLARESRALAAALRVEDEPVVVPAFRRPASPWHRLAAAAALVAAALGPVAIWAGIANAEWPAAIAWLNPFSDARLTGLVISFIVYVASEGGAMFTSIVETAGGAVLLALLGWGVVATVRTRLGGAALAAVALAAVVTPSLGNALEIRRSEQILTVPASETIDDTLVAFGESVEIDGTVNGDLVAFGRHVSIRGTVEGQVVTGAQSVTIDGDVGGSVLGFAEILSAAEAGIGRNFVGFGRDVRTREDTRVDGNAVVFASNADVQGPVGIDLVGFANELTIGGDVTGDVTAYANRVTLLAPARVGGDVVAHVSSEDALQVSPSAMIAGTVRKEVQEHREPESKITSGSFYAGQAVRFGAAFLTGLVVLGLAASLRRATPGDTGMEMLTTAGVGFFVAVGTPIVAVMAAVTLIGLPLAAVLLLIWGAALYFAKILFSYYLGRKLFDAAGRDVHLALALLVGLLIVLTLVNVPFVGGLVNFLLTVTGLGMLAIHLWGRFRGAGHSITR